MTTRTAELSERRARILACVQQHLARHRVAPSIREIKSETGIPSNSTVVYHLRRLEEAGYLRRMDDKARAIILTKEETEAADLRAVIEDHADNLDLLAEEVYDLDADTLHQALTARAEGLRAALATAGGPP